MPVQQQSPDSKSSRVEPASDTQSSEVSERREPWDKRLFGPLDRPHMKAYPPDASGPEVKENEPRKSA